MPKLNKYIGGTSAGSTPSLDEVAALLDRRGISIDPEVIVKRVVRYKASTDRVDSHGDIILASAWDVEEWLANPQFLLNHNPYDTNDIMGRGLDAQATPAGLFCDVFFYPPEFAVSDKTEGVFKLVKAGAFPDCSVGFRTKNRGCHWPSPDEEKAYEGLTGLVFTSVLLKELSTVTIGANVDAKVSGIAKSLNTLNVDDIRALRNDDSLGAMIDAAQFRLKGPTTMVQSVDVDLVDAVKNLTLELHAQRIANKKLQEAVERSTSKSVSAVEVEAAIGYIGSALEVLAKGIDEGGTPAPAPKSQTSEEIRNISGILERLEKITTNTPGA